MILRMFVGLLTWMSAAVVGAQPAPQWKFTPGSVYEYERIATQKQTVELKGKNFASDRRSVWLVRLEVIEKDAEAARILATLTKIHHHITPAVADEMIDAKLAEKMQGSTFKLTVTPYGRLVKIDGYENLLKRLGRDDQGKLKALRATFSEEALRQAFADLFGPLPEKKDGWKREYVEPIPHFGKLRAAVDYVDASTKNGIEQIRYAIRTKYELPKDDMSVLFRVIKGNIASEQALGTIEFDRVQGRLVQQERRMRLRGTLTLEVRERSQVMEFTSENEVKVRIKLKEL